MLNQFVKAGELIIGLDQVTKIHLGMNGTIGLYLSTAEITYLWHLDASFFLEFLEPCINVSGKKIETGREFIKVSPEWLVQRSFITKIVTEKTHCITIYTADKLTNISLDREESEKFLKIFPVVNLRNHSFNEL